MLPAHTGSVDTVFGRPLAGGGYLAIAGALHFSRGLLVGLQIDRGSDRAFFPCPGGTAVVCIFAPGPCLDPQRSWGTMRRLTFEDGLLVGQAPPVPALLDVSRLGAAGH
jgi:hypothetical protein